MKCFGLLWLCFCLTLVCYAQQSCPEYDRLMKEAEQFVSQGAYLKAFNKYKSAKTCSPANRLKVDAEMDKLFKKIDGERDKARKAERRMMAAIQKANILEREREMDKKEKDLMKKELEIAKVEKEDAEKKLRSSFLQIENTGSSGFNAGQSKKSDTAIFKSAFTSKNEDWLNKLSLRQQDSLLDYAFVTSRIHGPSSADSLASSFRLFNSANDVDTSYSYCSRQNMAELKITKLWTDKRGPASFYFPKVMDVLYFSGLKNVEDAMTILPEYAKEKYEGMISRPYEALNVQRIKSLQDFWLPDTVIELPDAFYYKHCADNNNFIWGYADYDDYRKTTLRFKNLSARDFTLTTDSSILLTGDGQYYNIVASAGNYKYKVVRIVSYLLKSNKSDYTQTGTSSAPKLVDAAGNIIQDFDGYSTSGYFFSTDGNFVATWKDNENLFLYNIPARKFVPLTDAIASLTMSISSDSKTIVYFNKKTKQLYFADMEGRVLSTLPSGQTGITDIENIDFTGNDRFLKIYDEDHICLFDIKQGKTIMNFDRSFVTEILVAPNGKDILITGNIRYEVSSKTYNAIMAFLVDPELNIKGKLYAECENYFFTPDGSFIVGYGEKSIMRWPVNRSRQVQNHFRTCLSFGEMVNAGILSFEYFMNNTDADMVERGARKFRLLAEDQTDPLVKDLYYRQSIALFNRLTYDHLKNSRRERVPFFYDWSSWIGRKMGDRDYRQQFSRQQEAVQIFDSLVNSRDSIYPQQLFYAANGNRLLANLYDSLGEYNINFIDQLKKELALREKLFVKDPENADNIYYFMGGLKKLWSVYDSVGFINYLNKEYTERFALYKMEQNYFGQRLSSLPDSFEVKSLYIAGIRTLVTSCFYLYIDNPGKNAHAIDSAFYYIDHAMSMSPSNSDSAFFLSARARAYLLQDNGNGLEKALDLYRQVLKDYPDWTKSDLLKQLDYMKKAGGQDNKNIQYAENFLKN